jgi:hypothetical protein
VCIYIYIYIYIYVGMKITGKFPETLESETLGSETIQNAVLSFYAALNNKFLIFLVFGRCDLFIQ